MFPTHEDFGKQRRFSHVWLKNNSPWLVYSKALDGGFCLPCVLFGSQTAQRSGQDLGALVTRPLKTFNKATELLRKHGSQIKYHKDAMIFMQNFMATMEQQRVSVYELAHSSHANLIQQNRQKLLSILKCVVFCGKQNISLRGHRMMTKFFKLLVLTTIQETSRPF